MKINNRLALNVIHFLIIMMGISGISNELKGQDLSSISIPYIDNYSSDIYKAGIQNREIAQAVDGRMYISNNLGLLEFDGRNWRLYGVKYGTKVRSIHIKEDRVFVGSQNDFGYFESNNTGALIYTSLADSLDAANRNFDETWKVYGSNELIYFCTFTNIYEYDGNQIKTITSEYPLEISFWIDHELIVQQWDVGLTKIIDQQLQLIPNGEFFKNKRVSSILPYNREKWLISTFNNGVYLYNQLSGEIKGLEMPFLPSNVTINTTLRLRDGNLAFGTQNSGLYLVSPENELVKHLDMDKGLMDNTINSLHEDKEGSLWLSLNNGISRVDINSPISFIDERAGISGAGYASLKSNSTYYLGTNNGLYQVNETDVQFIPNSSGQVYSIQEINNNILVGHHEGPMLLDKGRVRILDDEKGTWLFLPLPDNSGKMLTGTYLGINKVQLGKANSFEKFSDFEESSRVMAFDDRDLWITQVYKGAFKLSFDSDMENIASINLYNSNKGFPTDFLINVFEINGELLFTSESGFYRYNASKDLFEREDEFNYHIGTESIIVDMDEDVLGNIYYLEAKGIGKLEPISTGGYKNNSSSFGKVSNLWNDDLGNISALDSDQILIGARQGFILYEPRKDIKSNSEFSTQFSRIRLLGKQDSLLYQGHGEFAMDNEPIFNYANNSIAFDYFAPHFESGQKTTFQYKLENYDQEWSEWTSTDFKEYTNLKEGEYSFMVRAKSIYGDTSTPIHYTFEIKPPIYRTTGAYLFYGTGTLLLIFLGFKTQDHRHKEETKALEDSKNQQLDAKQKEIKDITEKSEQEIVELKNANLQAELNLKSQALTSSAMNLIQKNELLNQVKNTLKTMDKSELTSESNTQVNRLIKSIDRDLASAEEWTQFEENFDQVHGNFITRLKEAYPKLTPQEIKFSAYLRMNLNSKEIANLLNISVRGVEIGRYRVRKKLELERKDNLSDFLMRF